jgi:glucuronokinase
VIQGLEGLVYMDFARASVDGDGTPDRVEPGLPGAGVTGHYESLDPALLPPLYLAYWPQGADASQGVHGDLRARWEVGEPGVGETLDRIAALAAAGREALLACDQQAVARLMNDNFDLRRQVMDVSERDVALVERARALGASAKLPGSGGAIVGSVADDAMRRDVATALEELGAVVIEPMVLDRESIS